MFTGLVETLAPVVEIVDQPPGKCFVVEASCFRSSEREQDVKLGDSIAINGCCLTVVNIEDGRLSFEAGEETLSRTNLGGLVAGQSKVNLERSLRVGDRMGGHYVTGHIDMTGQLVERREDGPWAFLKFSIPRQYASQLVDKGSIAVDGISLTVVQARDDWFNVALIPHTLQVTSLGQCQVGDVVNLETDLIAKYVQRSMEQGIAPHAQWLVRDQQNGETSLEDSAQA